MSGSTIWTISESVGCCLRRRLSLPSKKCVSRFRDCRGSTVWQKSSVDWASSDSCFFEHTGTSAIEGTSPSSWYARAMSKMSRSSSSTSSIASSSFAVFCLIWFCWKSAYVTAPRMPGIYMRRVVFAVRWHLGSFLFRHIKKISGNE